MLRTLKSIGALAAVAVFIGWFVLHSEEDPSGRPERAWDGRPRNARHAQFARRVRAVRPANDEGAARADPGFPDDSEQPLTNPLPEDREVIEARVRRKLEFLDSSLRNEPEDREWSFEAEAELLRAGSLPRFARSRIGNIECRTTFCRFDVAHADGDAEAAFLDSFFPEVPSLPRAFSVRQEVNGGPGTVVYIARNGYSVPVFTGR